MILKYLYKVYSIIKPIRILFLFICLLILNSCIKDDFKKVSIDGWNPDLAIPIANTYYSIQDIINIAPENGFIDIGPTNLINIVYENEVYNVKAKDIIEFPNYDLSLDTAINLLELNINNQSILKEIVLKDGELRYLVSSSFSEPVRVILTIPNATFGNVSLKKDFIIPANSVINELIDISNYTLELENGSLPIEYHSELVSNGSPVELDFFNFSLTNLIWERINGFFGNLSLDYQIKPIDINIFEKWKKGSVHIINPKINIEFTNSFGLPFTTSLSNFDFIDKNSNSLNLSGSFTNTNVIINPLSFENTAEVTRYEINKNNSNITDILVLTPTQLNYDFQLYSNLTVDTSTLNFIDQDSELSVHVDVELPLEGRIEGGVFVDSFLVDFNDETPVNYVMFKLKTINFLPINVRLQVYMINNEQMVIDSLLKNDSNLFSSGPIDNNGRLIELNENLTFITLNTEQINSFNKTEKLYVKVYLETTNKGLSNVQFLSTNGLGLELGIQTEISL